MSAPRSVARLATLLGGGALLAIVVVLAAGVRVQTADVHDMAPTLHPGDALVTATVAPGALAVGELVVFPDPDASHGAGELLARTVTDVRTVGELSVVTTRTDGSGAVSSWTVPSDGQIGEVVRRLPRFGPVLDVVGSDAARVALLGLPALGLAALAVRPRRRRTDAPPRRPAAIGGAR